MERRCTKCTKTQSAIEFAAKTPSKLFAMCRSCRAKAKASASARAYRRETAAWGHPSSVSGDDPSVAFAVNQQPVVVYPLLPHYFAIPYGQSNEVDLVEAGTAGTDRVAFGVIALKCNASSEDVVALKRREAEAALLQEVRSMLELENEESEQDNGAWVRDQNVAFDWPAGL